MSKTLTITTGGRTFTLSNIGPLTTTFTPPADCLPSRSASDSPFRPGGPQMDCFPPGFQTGPSVLGYFSPGVCPVSYQQATKLAQWWLSPGETGAYCCPRYSPIPDVIFTPHADIASCASGFSVSGEFGTELLGRCSSALATPMTATYVLGTETTSATVLTLWEPPIPIIWRDQDRFARALSTDASETATHTGTAHSKHTATIAIATVVPVVVIVSLIVGLILHRRRCARPSPDSIFMSVPELEGREFWPSHIALPVPHDQEVQMRTVELPREPTGACPADCPPLAPPRA